jgi:flagellar export protein FliJ
MAFQFSLETLLRVRRSIERQQELKLLCAVRQVVSTVQEIEMADRAIAAVWASEQQELETEMRAAQLHFDAAWRVVLYERRKGLEKVLAEREALRAQCQKEFQAAHREREAVEVLREEQRERYRGDEERREQAQMDDLFLIRREYLLRR